MDSHQIKEESIADRIMDVIARTQKIDRTLIQLETTVDELGINSFDAVNILFALEDEFNIQLPNDFKPLHTIQCLVIEMQPFLHV